LKLELFLLELVEIDWSEME